MLKKTALLSIVIVMVLSISVTVCATDSINPESTRKLESVTKIKVLGNYHYLIGALSEEANLMPVENGDWWARVSHSSPKGYADRDGNIIISINENWTYASRFYNGLAMVYQEDKNIYSAINTKGEVVFNFKENTFLSSVGDTRFLQIFKDDPNNMFCAYVTGNGDSQYQSEGLTITLYTLNGSRIEKLLPYDRIGRFYKGMANLYMETKAEIIGYFGDPVYKREYTPIASINSKGEIFDTPIDEKNLEDNNTGFTSKRVDETNRVYAIKNRFGEEIYRYYDDSAWELDHRIINENALLVPVRKADGTTALTLMDYMGNLYPEYEFCAFDGVFGNRFIARPYKSYAEKQAYVKQKGGELPQDSETVKYNKDEPVEGLQPVTLYELKEIIEVEETEIQTSDKPTETSLH